MPSENPYDLKQQRLIQSWIDYADRKGLDAYSQFIALWIAFNAACYGRYFNVANRRRADLRTDTGLNNVSSTPVRLNGTIVYEGERFRLEVSDPGRIVITVSERYTEDIIFNEFASEFQEQYTLALRDEEFRTAVDEPPQFASEKRQMVCR